jgi:transposase-like protein
MMQKRMHTREFKLEVVRQIASGQKRPAQACREYGLAESVLSRWRKEYQERGEAAFASQLETIQKRVPTSESFSALLLVLFPEVRMLTVGLLSPRIGSAQHPFLNGLDFEGRS